jgi:hybrid cluster-associated redox disulfide protein|tara:strand:+ start:1038 stop:1244 length:207 start_codon:yes stop_codon:yes gene_type:complete
MKNKITKNMTLGETVSKYPESAEVLLKYGLHCIGCHVATWETLEQGAMAHGMDNKKLDDMLKELNNLK